MRCVYLYLLQKDTQLQYISCKQLEDIQMYCNCLSAFLQQIYHVNKTPFTGAILFLCNTTVILTRLVFKLKDL